MSRGFRCALSGHRELPPDFDKDALFAELEALLKEGYTTFYCGMARGFDLTALSYLIDRKGAYHVRIEAFIPYPNQELRYDTEEKKLYRALIGQCDVIHIMSEHYYRGAALVRDKIMVDRADIVFAYLRKNTGGTAYTVKYAQKNGVEVRFF